MRKHESEINAHSFGHGVALEGEEVVGLEREVDRFSERELHSEVWVDEEKALLVYHRVRFGLPVAVGTVENEQCRCFAASYA